MAGSVIQEADAADAAETAGAMQRWLEAFDGLFEELGRRGNTRAEAFKLLAFLCGRLQGRTMQVPHAPYVKAQAFDYMAVYVLLEVMRGVPMFGQRAFTEQLKRQARHAIEHSPRFTVVEEAAAPPAESPAEESGEVDEALGLAQSIGRLFEGREVDVVLTALRALIVQTLINLEVDKGSKFKGDEFLESVQRVVEQARAAVKATGEMRGPAH